MKYYGGCDSGSTYTKCVIIDETGKMVADVTLRSRINAVLSCEEMCIRDSPVCCWTKRWRHFCTVLSVVFGNYGVAGINNGAGSRSCE